MMTEQYGHDCSTHRGPRGRSFRSRQVEPGSDRLCVRAEPSQPNGPPQSVRTADA